MMQIFIKTINGKTITFNYNYNPKLNEVIEVIEKKIGIPAKYQRLEFISKRLDERKTFKDYNINNENTLYQYSKNSIRN